MPDDKDTVRAPSNPRSSMPARIGKYRIVNVIGRGAMGVVYSAHDEALGRPVALKVLIADLESDPDSRARFHREARAAGGLLHPNVITIFDAGEDNGRSFFVMQLLEGLPLAAYLKRPDAAALEPKLDLMIQMCDGLAAAHSQGIVHRDLKPSNLFVQSDGLLKILDFGVARLLDSSMTAAGTMLGTPDYMSPEQARGAPVDARSDIFSAGAVFYFVLTGRKPFSGLDLPTVLRQLQTDQPAPLGDAAPPELEALVMGAMAKHADDRPPRIEDLLATLVRFRRQYQSDTRKLVLTARAHVENIRDLIAAAGEAGATLGLPEDDSAAAALHGVQERFPPLSARASMAEANAFERGRVLAVISELSALRDGLTYEFDARRSYAAQLATGESELAAGDARAALDRFEAVAAACPQSPRARDLVESARPLAREQAARDERILLRVAAARRAIEEHHWSTAIAECRQVLALAPGHGLATTLLSEAEEAITREQRRTLLMTQRLVERAARAMEQHDFDTAEAALREAGSVSPSSTAVADLRRRLAAERAAAEAAALLGELSLEEIRRARSVFRRGRYHEAVQQLRGFLEVEPDAHPVAEELARLIALRDTLVSSAAAARRSATDLLNRAGALAQSGRLVDALPLSHEAMRLDPTDEAAAMVDVLLTRQLEERIAYERDRALDERARHAEPLIEMARLAGQRGFIANALRAALAAQRLVPGRSDVAQLIEDLREELTSEDREVCELTAPAAPDLAQTQPDLASAAAPGSAGVLDWAADLIRLGLWRGKA